MELKYFPIYLTFCISVDAPVCPSGKKINQILPTNDWKKSKCPNAFLSSRPLYLDLYSFLHSKFLLDSKSFSGPTFYQLFMAQFLSCNTNHFLTQKCFSNKDILNLKYFLKFSHLKMLISTFFFSWPAIFFFCSF